MMFPAFFLLEATCQSRLLAPFLRLRLRRRLLSSAMQQCQAVTSRRAQCRINAKNGSQLCYMHLRMLSQGKTVQTVLDGPGTLFERHRKTTAKGKDRAKKKKKPKDKTERKKNERAPPPHIDPVTECQCCFAEDVPFVACSKKPLTHRFCRDCLRGYIDSHLGDGNASATCMLDASDKCGGCYSMTVLQVVLDREALQRMQEQMQFAQVKQLASTLDHFHVCPFCQRYGLQALNIRDASCEVCDRQWCIKCRQESHPQNVPCEKLRNLDPDFVRARVEELVNDALMHTCPSCHVKYIKEDGCNLMTCPQCRGYSCYICGIALRPKNGLKYWHFQRHAEGERGAQCPLYCDNDFRNGNQVYNLEKLRTVCHRFCQANPEPEAQQVIRACITGLGYGHVLPDPPIVVHLPPPPPPPRMSWWRRWLLCGCTA